MPWKVTVPPDGEPLELAEAKSHLRLEHDDLDEDVLTAIESARQFVESTSGRALLPQTWELTLDGFPIERRASLTRHREILLPGGNVRSVDSIAYFDGDNVEQTLDTADYFALLTEPAKIAPNELWPCTYCRPDAVTVTLQVGYTNAAAVPSPIKYALRMHVELLIDRPAGDDRIALERARDNLLAPYIDGRLLT